MSSEPTSLLQRLEHLEHQYWQLVTEHQQLHAEHTQSNQRCERAELQYRQATRRLRVQGALAFCAVVGAILLSPSNRAALAQGYGVTLQQLQQQINSLQSSVTTDESNITALQSKTQFMSADATAKSTTFSGCNVYINNGLEATDGNPGDPGDFSYDAVVNGLGNLIIGYNEDVNSAPQTLTGSHNLILGSANSYSSFGGIVAGRFNTIAAPFACVTGGWGNKANGWWSSVNGGYSNTASGDFSSASGGAFNWAEGLDASISGGEGNTARGDFSSISGGGSFSVGGITESTDYGWAAGGSNGGTFHSP